MALKHKWHQNGLMFDTKVKEHRYFNILVSFSNEIVYIVMRYLWLLLCRLLNTMYTQLDVSVIPFYAKQKVEQKCKAQLWLFVLNWSISSLVQTTYMNHTTTSAKKERESFSLRCVDFPFLVDIQNISVKLQIFSCNMFDTIFDATNYIMCTHAFQGHFCQSCTSVI